MKISMTEDGSDCSNAVVDEGDAAGNAVVVNEWDADTFHRQVLALERQGYVVRRESYRVTPEMNPETGQITHLRTVELYRAGLDEAV